MVDFLLRNSKQRGENPQGCEASRRRSTLLAPKFYKIRRMADFFCHSRARGPRKYECIYGVDKAGILYPFSNNSLVIAKEYDQR